MKLCDNCLEPAVDASGRGLPRFPLGPARGDQRDPYHAEVDLCLECQDCLGGHLGGDERPVDLPAFVKRWKDGRFVESHERGG